MSQPIPFGDLRALLNAPYSPQSWDQLCDWVRSCDPDELRERLLPYLQAHLMRWSDAQRVVPNRWIASLKNNDQIQGFEITRYLNLSAFDRLILSREWRSHHGSSLRAIIRHPQLHTITTLSLEGALMTAEIMAALASSTSLTALHTLSLRGARHDDALPYDAFSQLASSPWLPQLTSLDLGHLHLTAAQLLPLLQSLARLHTLRLDGNTLDLSLFQQLGRHAPLANLSALHLGKIALSHSMLRAISGLPLHTLDLSQATLDASTLRYFADQPWAPSLRHLTLWGAQLDTNALHDMLSSQRFTALEELNLGKIALSSQLIRTLAHDPSFAQLRSLNLFQCELDDDSAFELMHSDHLSNLHTLNLLKNPLSPRMIQALQRAPHLQGVVRVSA